MAARATFLIDLGTTPEAHELLKELDAFIASRGYTRKGFYLTAAAGVITDKHLRQLITDYLIK